MQNGNYVTFWSCFRSLSSLVRLSMLLGSVVTWFPCVPVIGGPLPKLVTTFWMMSLSSPLEGARPVERDLASHIQCINNLLLALIFKINLGSQSRCTAWGRIRWSPAWRPRILSEMCVTPPSSHQHPEKSLYGHISLRYWFGLVIGSKISGFF